MDEATVHHAVALAGGLAAGACTFPAVGEPLLAGLTSLLWTLSLAGLLFGYRSFGEWCGDGERSAHRWLARAGALTVGVGAGTFVVVVAGLGLSAGIAAWMAASMATAAPLTAGIFATLALQEAHAAAAERAGSDSAIPFR